MNIRQWFSDRYGIARAIGGILACAIGARVVAPGINTGVLADFFRSGGASPLLRLYDWLVGGALARGALLALGVMPYISARIYLRLARIVAPTVGEPARRKKLTRWLTFGFSVVQSYGFARFAENLPGAVANPGPQFIATTMLALTASAMTAMWLWELPGAADEDTPPTSAEEADARSVTMVQPYSIPLLGVPAPELEVLRQKEPVVVDRL
jgi:preprotein translocase subunit SecY